MNATKNRFACLAVVILLTGCAGMNEHNVKVRQEKSSVVIGCAPNDIAVEITGTYTWAATCRQKVFHCKIVPGVLDTSATCVPALQ